MGRGRGRIKLWSGPRLDLARFSLQRGLLNCTPIRSHQSGNVWRKKLEQRPHCRRHAAIEIAIEEKAGWDRASLSESAQYADSTVEAPQRTKARCIRRRSNYPGRRSAGISRIACGFDRRVSARRSKRGRRRLEPCRSDVAQASSARIPSNQVDAKNF